MSHPCDGHPCDHCYLCDVVGICCMTVARTTPAASAVGHPDSDEPLRQAILAEQRKDKPGLPDLIRAEGSLAKQSSPLLLAAPQPVPPLPVNQAKELSHEQVARAPRR